MNRLAAVLLVALGGALAACATPEVKPAPPPPVAAPAPPPQPPLPELPVTQIEPETTRVPPRKLFSLSVRDADVRDILLAFSKQTDLNLVFDQTVKGAVTVDLKRVTLEEALDALLSPLGLVYRREGNLVRVFAPVPETRIFTVSYIPTARAGVSSLAATAGGTAGGAGATTATTTGGGTAGGAASSSVTSTDNIDLWAELEKTLVSFLSPQGKAVISRNTGLIAVTDLPVNLNRVARYLELVQGAAQRQVMIEAQIIEVTLSKDFSAGVDWTLIPRELSFSPLGSVRGTLNAGALAAQLLAPTAGIFQIGLATRIAGQGLQLLLRALSRQGNVAILSSPKVSTLNNQKAVMKVAVDDVFFNVVRTREATTGIVTETVTAQTVTEGIVLDVTPHIGEDDTVIMNIRPSITERVGQATSPTGGVVPIVAVRASDTVVRVRDGQTVVIGGLMQSRSTKNTQGTPVLQDVPVVGGFFKQKTDEDRKTELVILLTPTVLIGRRHSELTPQEADVLRQLGTRPPLR